MNTVFILLFLLCLVAMIVGLIKPSILSKMFKGNVSRKKIALVFGVATLVFFIIAGATTPKDSTKQAEIKNNPVTQQPEQKKSEQKTNQQQTQTITKTLEERVTDAINNSLGTKNNTKKQRVMEVEVNKYNTQMLSLYKYNSGDSVVGLLIRVNADENITTNLQKGTMNDEATKIAQVVFPIDPTIGDIIIWSQLPVKDQYGNVKDDTAIIYSISRSLFNKINWSNFNHNDLPSLLKSEVKIDDRNGYFEKIKF